MSFLERIQKLCETNGINVSQLEKELGFGNGSIYRWDTSSPSIKKVQKVANFFKVSTDYISYGYEYRQLVDLINVIKNERTNEQFAKEAGIDANWLFEFEVGISDERPTLDILEKIAASNPVDYLVTLDDLLVAAGYKGGRNLTEKLLEKQKRTPPVQEKSQTIAAHRSDDPTSELPEDARKSIEDFKKFIYEKHGIKYD